MTYSNSIFPNNDATLDAYNAHVEEYIAATSHSIDQEPPEVKTWIDAALQATKPGGAVFEIGSATPRDATYIRSMGHPVTCSDAAHGFVEYLRRQGEPAINFDVLTDNFPGVYDLIFANAVFPHFTADQLRQVITQIHSALSTDGVLAFSIKSGSGEEWLLEKFDAPRFTHYWQEADIIELLKHAGFTIVFESSNVGSLPSHHWINIVAKKV